VHTGVWWGNLRERDHLEDPGVNGRILGPIHTMLRVSVPSPLHLRSFRLVCARTVRRVQSPSGASDKKKRMWVNKCFRSRKLEGEYKELADDEIKFYQYFRMSKHQFNYLLQKSGKDLKKNTTFREAVSPVEKLATCLR